MINFLERKGEGGGGRREKEKERRERDGGGGGKKRRETLTRGAFVLEEEVEAEGLAGSVDKEEVLKIKKTKKKKKKEGGE